MMGGARQPPLLPAAGADTSYTGTNLRLTQWLPGKLAEGHAPHHPLIVTGGDVLLYRLEQSLVGAGGKYVSYGGEACAGQAGDVQRARELAP